MHTDIIESFKRGNLTVKIMVDDDPMHPRRDFDNIGRMVCAHRRYRLGDEDKTLGFTFRSGDFDGWKAVRKYLIEEQDAFVTLPLFLYDHSGLSISTSKTCDWDSGQVGFSFMTNAAAKKHWPDLSGKDLEQAAIECLCYEIHDYDTYLRGDVYFFEVCDHKGVQLESCGGIYGVKSAREEAIAIADAYEAHTKAAIEKTKQEIHAARVATALLPPEVKETIEQALFALAKAEGVA